MSERRLVTYVLNNIDDQGHFSSVEAHASQPGILDYAYTTSGINGWIEFKWGTPTNPPDLRLMQKVWIDRNIKFGGGRPLILCGLETKDNATIFGLIPGSKTREIYRANTAAWYRAMTVKWSDKILWGELLHYLRNPNEAY
jgi:hypothetical protein